MHWLTFVILSGFIYFLNVNAFMLIDPLKSVWSSLYLGKLSSVSDSNMASNENIMVAEEPQHKCSACIKNRVTPNEEIEHILNEIRVEYVKQQILKKLRLEKPPDVSISLSTLPKPLINGYVLELRPGEPFESEKQAESFYGKTDQIVVFPNEGKITIDYFFIL